MLNTPTQLTAFSLTAALLAGCAGASTATLPPNTNGAAISGIDPAARTGALLYVTDARSKNVLVFTYPGGKLAQAAR